MAKYDRNIIQRLLNESDTAPNTDIKGDKLEQLVRYLFEKINGVSFAEKNALDGFRAHELDVIFFNDTRLSALHFLDAILITECKNTASRLSSGEVGWFVRKLQDRGSRTGILVSLSGITGAFDGVSNAHSEVIMALARDKISILLVNREEIESLVTTSDLTDLLKEKILKLTIHRTII